MHGLARRLLGTAWPVHDSAPKLSESWRIERGLGESEGNVEVFSHRLIEVVRQGLEEFLDDSAELILHLQGLVLAG